MYSFIKDSKQGQKKIHSQHYLILPLAYNILPPWSLAIPPSPDQRLLMKLEFYYSVSQRNLRTCYCLLRKYFICEKHHRKKQYNIYFKGLVTFLVTFSLSVESMQLRVRLDLSSPQVSDWTIGISFHQRKQKEESVVMELDKQMKSSNWTLFQVMYKQMEEVSTSYCICISRNGSELNPWLGSHQWWMGVETRD